jgi:putative membrane protein
LKKFVIQLLINAFAFFVAITLLRGHGIQAQGSENLWLNYLVLGLIFSLVNAVLRPIIVSLGCPVIILTLGLGILLINTLLFYLTGVIGKSFGFGFTVDGFVPAFLGALIVSLIGMVLNVALRGELKDK